MQTITANELSNLLAKHPQAVLLDVRTPAEFAGVHVPRALNIPLNELPPAGLLSADTIDKTQTIYLLCQSGWRARNAAEKLLRDGFKNPVVLDGGTQAWVDAGLPVEGRATKVISLERQVRIAAGSLVVIGMTLGWLVHRDFFALPAFVGAGLVFAGITDFCGMGLLLVKLPWNRRVAK